MKNLQKIKVDVKNSIAHGKTKLAIESMLTYLSPQEKYKDYEKIVIMKLGLFNTTEKRFLAGTIDDNYFNLIVARISDTLLKILDEIELGNLHPKDLGEYYVEGEIITCWKRENEKEAIEKFYNEFKKDSKSYIVIISGKGGTGKTTLAKYIVNKAQYYEGINSYEVDANGKDLKKSILQLGAFLRIDSNSETINPNNSLTDKIYENLSEGSIIFFDNIGSYKKSQSLIGQLGNKKVFIIITTNILNPPPFKNNENIKFKSIKLEELNKEDYYFFLEKNLSDLAWEKVKEFKNCLDKIFIQELRFPLYIELICNLIENKVIKDKSSNIPSLLDEVTKEILIPSKEIDKISERLVGKSYSILTKGNSKLKKILLASSLFAQSKIPLTELVNTSGPELSSMSDIIQTLKEWEFFIHECNKDENEEIYFSISSPIHSFLRQKFQKESFALSSCLKENFVSTWIKFISQNNALNILLDNSINIGIAIKYLSDVRINKEIENSLKEIKIEHLFLLQKILPPKERFSLLSELLKITARQPFLAYLYIFISESFQHQTNFKKAEDFALLSLNHFTNGKESRKPMAYAYRRLGGIYRRVGKFKESLEVLKKASKIYKGLKDNLSYADTLRKIAQTYNTIGPNKKALQNISESIKILNNLKLENPTAEVLNTLAYSLNTHGRILMKRFRLKEAVASFEKAKKMHSKSVGYNHFYVGYDLRFLAIAEGHIADLESNFEMFKSAIENLRNSEKITQSFFGESSPLAMVYLAFSKVYHKKREYDSAMLFAKKAETIFNTIKNKNNFYYLNVYAAIAEILIEEEKITDAIKYLKYANEKFSSVKKSTFLSKEEDAPWVEKLGLIECKILILQKKYNEAAPRLWGIKSKLLKRGNLIESKEVDRVLISCLFRQGEKWDASAKAYKQYLIDFPESIHHKLGQQLIESLTRKVILSNVNREAEILDIFCGTGFISEGISKRKHLNFKIIGLDGSKEMINHAKTLSSDGMYSNLSFINASKEYSLVQNEKFDFMTIQMGIFQIDLRNRHLLFQDLTQLLNEKCSFIFSVYSADFTFPEINFPPSINAVNSFKNFLFKEFRSVGFNPPTSLDESIKPVYTKENYHTLSCFFELYGFQLEPINIEDIIEINRPWEERIAFTKIPVISEKIFGREIEDRKWKKVESSPKDYHDTTFGAILIANKIKHYDSRFRVFSHVNVDFTRGYEVKYAIAAVLRNDEGKTLFLQRGSGARDFNDSWSLPSSFADEGKGLLESYKISMKKNLGLDIEKLDKELTPRSIRFNLRSDSEKPWIMAMCVYSGTIGEQTPILQNKKYKEIRWEDSYSFINTNLRGKPIGDCIKSYRDLIQLGELL